MGAAREPVATALSSSQAPPPASGLCLTPSRLSLRPVSDGKHTQESQFSSDACLDVGTYTAPPVVWRISSGSLCRRVSWKTRSFPRAGWCLFCVVPRRSDAQSRTCMGHLAARDGVPPSCRTHHCDTDRLLSSSLGGRARTSRTRHNRHDESLRFHRTFTTAARTTFLALLKFWAERRKYYRAWREVTDRVVDFAIQMVAVHFLP